MIIVIKANADADSPKEAASDSFHLHTVSGELVQPNLDLDRTSALLVAEDELAYFAPKSDR